MAALTMDDCTASSSCPTERGFVSSPPHLAGNAFLLSAFTALIPINIFFGMRYRMPLYASFLVPGLALEILGHIGRIMLRENLASRAYYIMVALGTVTGPTFISAAIFVVLPHVLAVYGERLCVTPSPLWIGLFFFGFDVFTLAFQIVGVVFFVNGVTEPEMTQGVNVLLAGMGVQAASLVLYFVVYYCFLFRLSRNRLLFDRRHEHIYGTFRFKIFLACLQIAVALILVRTITRIVQLSAGPTSVTFQSQTLNMVLDSSVILITCLVLTLAPPGVAFGREAWKQTSPHRQGYRGRRRRGRDLALQAQRSPYFVSSSPRSLTYGHPYSPSQQTPRQTTGLPRDPRENREPKPFEHQVPAHWQYPNLHKPAPRPSPVVVHKYEDGADGEPLYMEPGSAGSQQHRDSRRGSKQAPPQRDLVDEEALWG